MPALMANDGHGKVDRVEPDVLADKVLELPDRDLAQSLEARDLVARAEQFNRSRTL